MAEISPSKSVSIQLLTQQIELYKSNPSAIQRVVYDYLEEVTNGEVDLVDPTNPFIFLLESSSVNTAVAVNENLVGLRRLYPSQAQNTEDLYRHLSDKDYLDRFATPSEAEFTVVVQVNDIMSKMVKSESENCYKATIPRDSRFEVDDYVFTLQYPIDIRKFDNGVVQLSYDAEITSPLQTLSNNIIDYVVRYDTNNVGWLFFSLKVKQFAVESTHFTLQKSILFNQTLSHNDQFYYIRAFYRNQYTNNEWVEMLTSHSQQVFDPFKPTMLVQTFDQYIKVNIPPVYLNSNAISGEVRVDLYTTKGQVSVNLNNYKPDSFGLSPTALNEERDITEYTNAFASLAHYVFSRDFIAGGTNGIDFETLRERVIHNATGENNLPITPNSLQAAVEDSGFELVKNVDTITNRIFLATQKLPKPANVKLATSANVGISSVILNTDVLKTLTNVRHSDKRLTILSKNLYRNDNGVISILMDTEVQTLKQMSKTALVGQVNAQKYLFNPFYYVLDSSNEEFEVRAYNLDQPYAQSLSFVSQNQTLQLPVNTGQYTLSKHSYGYKVTVVTKSGNFYKQLADGLVSAQLGFYPQGEKRLVYINGVLIGKTADEERVYEFTLETNYDLNSKDALCVTNGRMFGNEALNTWIDLKTDIQIFYASSSVTDGFIPDAADALLGKFMLPANSVVSTRETLTLNLGTSLKNLWCRSRSIAATQDYKVYTEDVPMFYTEDVYQVDPTTGTVIGFDAQGKIKYNILHSAGDPVLDNAGNQVYLHRKGDVVLLNGEPVLDTVQAVKKEIDILFVDGRHYFVDDEAFVSYNDELVSVLDTWINDNIDSINDRLLEKTSIYFYPKTTLGKVAVYTEDDGQDILDAEQSLVVDLYVKNDIYSDSKMRQELEDITVRQLDAYISGTVINMTEIENSLRKTYGNSVVSFQTSGLGGDKNYRLLNLAGQENRLALKKILFQQQDTSLIIKEDVTVNFLKVK